MATDTVTATITAKFKCTNSRTENGRTVDDSVSDSIKATFTDGTGDDNVDTRAVIPVTFTDPATTVDVDLTSITDIYGQSVSFSAVKSIMIDNTGTHASATSTAVDITIGPDASNGWTALVASGTRTIEAGGFELKTDPDSGMAVSGTDKILEFGRASGTGNYILMLYVVGVA